MNYAICDDNPKFIQTFKTLLQDCCAKRDWLCDFYSYTSAAKLLGDDLSEIQVLFLDIEMPGINGLQTGELLREKYPDLLIVFVTAFIEYAPAGYRVRAFRYLMKDRILCGGLDECLDDIWAELYISNESIEVQGDDRTIMRFRLRDIIYLEGAPDRHTLLHLFSSIVRCRGKISEFDEQLSNRGFLRLQKSFLANMWHIRYIKGYYAYMSNGESLKLSLRNYQEIRNTYLRWKGHNI